MRHLVFVTQVLITIDTELSAGRQAAGWSAAANFQSSVLGRCAQGDFGVPWLMDRLEDHGLRGVFFVDAMPAGVLGQGVIDDIVGPIVARGHDVQLHAHTEWLPWFANKPVAGRTGPNINCFARDDQIALLRLAKTFLEEAGAPKPRAFRAGNYGANDDTLSALGEAGLTFDTSLNPAYRGKGCDISTRAETNAAFACGEVIELPVTMLRDTKATLRPAQVCAMSSWEMVDLLNHAAAHAADPVVVVTHSFEMLSRDRRRPNRMVMQRFERLCAHIAAHPDLACATFNEPGLALSPHPDRHPQPLAPPSRVRTTARHAEQAIATIMFEHRLRP